MKTLILGLLFLGGCVQATVTEPRACDATLLSFPGAPVNPGLQLPPVTQSFTLDTGAGSDLTQVKLLNGQLTLADAGDFSFLDEIMISVADPNGGADLVLWDSQHNSGTQLAVQASDANLVNYIDGNNKFTINVTISTQQPPQNTWQLDVALCVSAELDKTVSL